MHSSGVAALSFPRLSKEAAQAARLDMKHWQDIEGARTNPTVATLVGIARALEITLAALFKHDSNA